MTFSPRISRIRSEMFFIKARLDTQCTGAITKLVAAPQWQGFFSCGVEFVAVLSDFFSEN